MEALGQFVGNGEYLFLISISMVQCLWLYETIYTTLKKYPVVYHQYTHCPDAILLLCHFFLEFLDLTLGSVMYTVQAD